VTVVDALAGTSARAAQAVGHVARAVCVVSARHEYAVHAMTVDSLSVVSAEPARVVLAVRPESRWWELASASGGFAVSVLSAGQEDVARWFASRRRGADEQQFRGVGFRPGPVTGAPLIAGASAWFEAEIEALSRVADQVILVARVADEAGHDPGRPVLVRLDRSYRRL
jgi:flavin reductase (DIM6/NTAB) family NADH-FMN oxidoreductase RutF